MQQDKIPTNEIKRCPPHGMEKEVQQTLTVRDDRLDSVKYWLIVLVITVHVFQRPEFSDSTIRVGMWKGIAIFVMPLFIFISGYFSRKNTTEKFLSNIWKLMEPLIIFQAIISILHNGIENLFVNFLTPIWILWYLLSLIYWRIMLQIIPDNILKHRKIVMICMVCISILAGFLPFDRYLSLQRTLAYMPFFFLGYYMRGKNLCLPDRYKPFCFVIFIFMFVIPLYFPQYLGDLTFAIPYKSIYGAAQRIIIFIIAVPMSVAFLNICYNAPWIARQGRMSMHYYLFHALMIKPLIMVVGKLNIPMNIITAVIMVIVIAFVISFLLKLSYIKMLTNPSLFFVKKGNIKLNWS